MALPESTRKMLIEEYGFDPTNVEEPLDETSAVGSVGNLLGEGFVPGFSTAKTYMDPEAKPGLGKYAAPLVWDILKLLMAMRGGTALMKSKNPAISRTAAAIRHPIQATKAVGRGLLTKAPVPPSVAPVTPAVPAMPQQPSMFPEGPLSLPPQGSQMNLFPESLPIPPPRPPVYPPSPMTIQNTAAQKIMDMLPRSPVVGAEKISQALKNKVLQAEELHPYLNTPKGIDRYIKELSDTYAGSGRKAAEEFVKKNVKGLTPKIKITTVAPKPKIIAKKGKVVKKR